MGRTAVLSLNAASLASPRLSPDMHDSGVHKRGKSSPTTSRVRRDAERAKKLGHIIKPSGLRSGGVQFVGHEVAKHDQPTGLAYFSSILKPHEQNAVVDVVNSVPEEKRSPWSTEGFGGRYQKVYFISEEQVGLIQAQGYPWNRRRMEHQTVYDPEEAQDPGAVLLTPNIYSGHPLETLTERVRRLCPHAPGKKVVLLATQANWMQGSDFPTHKDQPDKEGWGQIIAALSLGSGGHLVMKDPVISEAWTMHLSPGDVYYMKDSVRWEWEHGMAADNADLRISLVWRFQEVDA